MGDNQKLVTQLRLDDLVKKRGPDPVNWGIPHTSKLLEQPQQNLPRHLIVALHRLAKHTRTHADRDFVTRKIRDKMTDRITDALFEPPTAPLDRDDLIPSDVDHVYNKLQKTFEAVDALYEASGDNPFRWLPHNHQLADSALAWDFAFIKHFTALMKAHPGGHIIMSTKVFPRAIESRRELNPNSPDWLTTKDLMSVPDVYAKVLKEMPEMEQEESEEAEEENKEKGKEEEENKEKEKAEEPEYPSAPRYKTAYGKMLAGRLDNLELGFKDLRKDFKEAKKEIRGP
ncbi:hypothetical protein BFW01_g3043 [Lasiodiplodia theobromae]|nr:hypothetical protein BFW01_g3043 [Lasiodiplodia theobromae]